MYLLKSCQKLTYTKILRRQCFVFHAHNDHKWNLLLFLCTAFWLKNAPNCIDCKVNFWGWFGWGEGVGHSQCLQFVVESAVSKHLCVRPPAMKDDFSWYPSCGVFVSKQGGNLHDSSAELLKDIIPKLSIDSRIALHHSRMAHAFNS